MLFDKLCGIAERHMPPKFSDILKKMHLFQFDEKTEEILSRLKWNREQEQFLRDNFFLPFQYVAIEDPASCVLFWDDSDCDERRERKSRCRCDCVCMRALYIL
jgi:hypothetical protein